MTADKTRIEALVRAELARLAATADVPGVAVAVAAGGHIVEGAHGVVNTDTQQAVGRNTSFQVQSISKVFTATLIMQLVEAGRVQLDKPVRAYLPEFRTKDASASAKITVRHLLTHSGGFEGDLWQPTTAELNALDRFVWDLVSDAAQYNEPGNVFSYCSAGFGVLGRLAEVVLERTYEDALRTYILEPLAIDHVAFTASQALAFATAIGHVRRDPSGPLVPAREWALMPPSNPAAGNQLAMSTWRLAGAEPRATVHEIRPNGDGTFSVVSGARATRSVSFFDPGPGGVFQQLAGERVAARQSTGADPTG